MKPRKYNEIARSPLGTPRRYVKFFDMLRADVEAWLKHGGIEAAGRGNAHPFLNRYYHGAGHS